jgi:AraC-like DNA-binding protein
VVDQRVLQVPSSLRRWVADISLLQVEEGTSVAMQLPDPSVSLAVRSSGGGRRDVLIMGPRTRAIYSTAGPGPSCLQLRLQPGIVVLPVDRLRGLVDDVALLDRTSLAGALTDLDADAVREPAEVRRLATVLATDLSTNDGSAHLIRRAADLLPHEPVHAVARRLGMSERHLRNLFARTTGLAPKLYTRIQRVRAVLASVHRGDLAGLAMRAGYYDQAHMTTEFRRLVGVPPGAFAAGKRPAPRPCIGLDARDVSSTSQVQ